MVLVAWFTATAQGAAARCTGYGAWLHPAGCLPMQSAALIIDRVLVPLLATYTVWVAWFTAIPAGPVLTVTVAGGWPQPEVTVALQVAPLITDTVWPGLPVLMLRPL